MTMTAIEGRRVTPSSGSIAGRSRRAAACALLLAVGLVLGPARAANAGTTARASIGFEPTPLSLATDPAGHVFLSNPQRSRQIQEYSSDGALLAARGDFARSEGIEPRDVSTDAAGDVWVADGSTQKVIELGSDGTVLRGWGARGRSIAIGPDGYVYIAGSTEVERYSADGTLISQWPSPSGTGEAWDLAVGPEGLVYVADTYGNQVEVFEPDGTFVRRWSAAGGAGRSALPYGIAVAPSGDVYLADAGSDRVAEFHADGSFVRGWGGPGGKPGRFYTPTGIAVGPEGSVYVADAGEEYPDDGYARVQKFTGAGKFVAQWGEVPALRAKLNHRTTKDGGAVFRFTSRQQGARFECRLHGPGVPKKLRRWNQRCSSPKRYVHLAPGKKVFEVWTVLGHRTSGAARYTWNVPASAG